MTLRITALQRHGVVMTAYSRLVLRILFFQRVLLVKSESDHFADKICVCGLKVHSFCHNTRQFLF